MKARKLVLGIVFVVLGIVFVLAFVGISIPVAITSATHLVPGLRVLAPMAYSVFCQRYPKDCESISAEGRMPTTEPKPVKMTLARRAQLAAVNRRVNDMIAPQHQCETAGTEKWVINPTDGDCNDYVVSKRHQLLAKGWPAHALLMAEVALPTGEHHLVLVVVTSEGELVLDNLNPRVRTMAEAKADYKWIRMQSNKNQDFWHSLEEKGLLLDP